jgi:hypothetical protein
LSSSQQLALPQPNERVHDSIDLARGVTRVHHEPQAALPDANGGKHDRVDVDATVHIHAAPTRPRIEVDVLEKVLTSRGIGSRRWGRSQQIFVL